MVIIADPLQQSSFPLDRLALWEPDIKKGE